MTKNVMNIAKIAGVGMIVGAAVGAAGGCLANGRRSSTRRKMHHAADSISDMIGNFSYMFK